MKISDNRLLSACDIYMYKISKETNTSRLSYKIKGCITGLTIGYEYDSTYFKIIDQIKRDANKSGW